jgi:hypothetical protein
MTDVIEPVIPLIGEPDSEVIAELTSGLVRITRRAEIYEADGVTPFDIPNWDARLIDGTVTVDRERDERRNLDLLLDNTDNALINDPYDGFWYDKIIKIFWGIKYYDQVVGSWRRWETPLGEFMIDRIDEDRFPHAIKVTGRDYTKKCLNSKLPYSVTFQTGLRVEEIIANLALNAGVKKFLMPVTTQAYSDDLVFTRGTERWKVMKQLADTIGYELYFLPNGALTMRPYPDPTTSPIAWNFTDGTGGSLVSYSRSSTDSRVFNHILVTGAALGTDSNNMPAAQVTASNTDSEVIFAEARNDDPGSPTRIDRIGDRVELYESDLFTSNEQALAYAKTQLRIGALEEYTMGFQSLILPWLDGSDIVEIVEDRASEYTPRRFLLSNFTIPLGLGAMSGTARRVTVVGTKQTMEFI